MVISNTRKYTLVILISEAVLSITAGGMIYIIFRPDTLVMFGWFEQIHISDFVYYLRNSYRFSFLQTFDVFINTAPGGLWTFSYTALLLLIWKFEINIRNIFYFIFIPVIAIASEFLQLTDIINGTFDYADIISYTAGAVLPLLIHFHKIKFKLT